MPDYGVIPGAARVGAMNNAGGPPAPANPAVSTQNPVGTNAQAATANPYGIDYNQTSNEQAAGVSAQPFYSTVGQDGKLKSSYAVDPSQSAAFNQLSQVAQSSDLSPWAQLQMQSNTNAAGQQRDQANAQAQGSMNQSLQSLQATGGGTNSGVAALLAANANRNQLMADQQVGYNQQQNALNIQQTDATNKQNLLGTVANTQTSAQAANVAAAQQDATNANTYSANRYNQQMAAYGAKQTANAQTQAANSGKK